MGRILVRNEYGELDRCPDCGEPRWYVGKRFRDRTKACLCTPEPEPVKAFGGVSPKTREVTAKVGRRGEKRTVQMLTGAGLEARLTAGSGATASRSCERAFDTDLVARLGDSTFKVESKVLARVPGLTSFRGLLAGSDMLRVEQDGEGFWFIPDNIMAELGGLASEAVEGRKEQR